MTTLLPVLFGAGVGAGVFVVLRAFGRRRAVSLSQLGQVLASRGHSASELDEPEARQGAAELSGLQMSLGRLGAGLTSAVGIGDPDRVRDRLRVVERSYERHCYEKMLLAVTGFSLPVLTGAMVAAGGVQPPVALLLVGGLAAAFGGFVYPDLALNDQVEDRRRAFRHALSSYLDLVTIMMAGGAGLRSALEGAADAGDGWAFAEIRGALRRAETGRRTVWEAFTELADDLGIDELRDLSASVALAGEAGARVKDSLSAKADAMRATQAAQMEAAAESQTEKMIVPVVILIVGLVLFIGYGAMEAITSDGSQFQEPANQPIVSPTEEVNP